MLEPAFKGDSGRPQVGDYSELPASATQPLFQDSLGIVALQVPRERNPGDSGVTQFRIWPW
jgi:hypothetical protein